MDKLTCRCHRCGEPFAPKTKLDKYCSPACSYGTPAKSYPIDRECDVCGVTFVAHNPNTRFCGKDCRDEHTRRQYAKRAKGKFSEERVCETCQEAFIASTARAKYCSDKCREVDYRRRKNAEVARKSSDIVDTFTSRAVGAYVYGWYDGDECFYVGKGVDRRAWEPHIDESGRSMACETRKINAANFYIVIFRDRLTQEGAYLVESVLIDVLKPFCNQVAGLRRQEVEPLTIESLMRTYKSRW